MFKYLFIILIPLSVYAQDIYVKYRGYVNVDNANFKHLNIQDSSIIHDMYYDASNNYLIIKIQSTNYHYCGLPKSVIHKWISSSSLGRYYLSNIKGNYDCRVYPMPRY